MTTFKLDQKRLLVVVTHDCAGINPITGKPLGKVTDELPIGMMGHMVLSNKPLTIVPEILCPRCDLSGTITDGKWVAA